MWRVREPHTRRAVTPTPRYAHRFRISDPHLVSRSSLVPEALPAPEFEKRRAALLRQFDASRIFDPLAEGPRLLPARAGQRRTLNEPTDIWLGRRTVFRADVPRHAFRHFFANVFVGHEHMKTWKLPISKDFERGLRLIAAATDEWDEPLRLWQEQGRAILNEYGRLLDRRKDPRGNRPSASRKKRLGPRFIADSSELSLLLRTFGGYLTLADRSRCTREQFFSTIFPAMVKASKIAFYLPDPRSLAQQVGRAGGDVLALGYANSHISILHQELHPFRFRTALSRKRAALTRKHSPERYSD